MSTADEIERMQQIAKRNSTAADKARARADVATIAALVGALRKYGRHDAGCMYYHHGKDGPCTCGLDALIEKYTTTDAEGMR
jgi:hypothetical protein